MNIAVHVHTIKGTILSRVNLSKLHFLFVIVFRVITLENHVCLKRTNLAIKPKYIFAFHRHFEKHDTLLVQTLNSLNDRLWINQMNASSSFVFCSQLFRVEVLFNGRKHFVLRRNSEFQTLHRKVCIWIF